MKQAQPNFKEYNFIRQLRNAFVYSLGLFTQLSIKKSSSINLRHKKHPSHQFCKEAVNIRYTCNCSNETVFLGGEAWLSVFFRGSVKTELKQAQPNFKEYNYIRQLRNAFVYSLGLFTQLSMEKSSSINLRHTKHPSHQFCKEGVNIRYTCNFSNETVFNNFKKCIIFENY